MIHSKLSKGIFSDLITSSISHMSNISDNRQTSNAKKYSIESAGIGALSVFLMQDPSFLSHQKRLSTFASSNNFTNLFGGIKEIPSANQIRNMLDNVSPHEFNPLFDNGLSALVKEGGLKDFKIINGYLIALDGTEYYSSRKIKCDCCSSRTHKDITTYHHSMLAASIVNPDIKEAIALIPEFIVPQDGNKKQDCENAAIKRWLANNGKKYQYLNPTILGDDLLSRQPICEAILEQDFNFILVCKPDSHKTLFEYLDGIELDKASFETRKRNKRYQYQYKFINQIPIKDGKNALNVNWLEITQIDKKTKKVIYKNSFITNRTITQDNVRELANSGRSRWKIENENNNTLKTKGYHFEHNYGHGKKNLSSVFASLAIIAFLYHTIMNITDILYIKAKDSKGTRENFYNTIKAYTQLLLFESWESLMRFIIKPPDKLERMKF